MNSERPVERLAFLFDHKVVLGDDIFVNAIWNRSGFQNAPTIGFIKSTSGDIRAKALKAQFLCS